MEVETQLLWSGTNVISQFKLQTQNVNFERIAIAENRPQKAR